MSMKHVIKTDRQHLIKSEKDMFNHIVYIQKQAIEHELEEDKFLFIDKEWKE